MPRRVIRRGEPMAHEEIRPERMSKAPHAPFSLATRTRGSTVLHLSGQVAQGPDGATVGRGDIERQTIQVLENIWALVEAAGGTLADVARIVVYLTSRDHLPAVLDVRRRYFREPYPASTGLSSRDWPTWSGSSRSRRLPSSHEARRVHTPPTLVRLSATASRWRPGRSARARVPPRGLAQSCSPPNWCRRFDRSI
jgi:enamine deaminase RidA (YjgF/YER057c/UK114 family)